MDPLTLLMYLLTLPLRIMAEMLRNAPFPGQGGQNPGGSQGLWNIPTRQSNDIDAPYTVREAEPYVNTVREAEPQAASTYVNEESWEIEWSEEGLPTRITVHRNAQRT